MNTIKDKTPIRFSGIKGIKQLYYHILESWNPKDTYYIVSAPVFSFTKLENFFINKVHSKRISDRVFIKMIINRNAQNYGLIRKNMPFCQVKFVDIETTAEYGILNDLLFIVNYGKSPYAVLIKDKDLADTFKTYFELLWAQGRTVKIPPLVKINKSFDEIIKEYIDKNPTIICDEHNYKKISKKEFKPICIRNNNYSNIKKIKKEINKNKNKIIIGIGGCTALDAARACSNKEIPCILIPTILSTVCISVDKSVLKVKGETRTFNTEPPEKVVLSMKEVMKTKRFDLVRWSQAGFGDLFAKIGASIDVVYRQIKNNNDTMSLDKVRRNIPEVFDAIDYVLDKFNNYNKKDLESLAVFLHEASVAIIIQDTFELSGGAEHNLAYILEKKYLSKNRRLEHGILVSIGSLIEFKLFEEITGDNSLYKKMRIIYKKLKLPTTYNDLKKIGITKEYLIKSINDLKGLHTFMSAHSNKAIKLLDIIFKK
jgi:glycerol dehydrogenase-like iron-containing ADH family enzyme